MTVAAPIHLAGERLMLDPAGAVFWPAEAVLVVSDLHLEKGSSFARRGMLLPPWDTKATLDRLAAMLRRFKPRTVVALGDSFHDAHGASRLDRGEVARLAAMTSAAAVHLDRRQSRPVPARRPRRPVCGRAGARAVRVPPSGRARRARASCRGTITRKRRCRRAAAR